jgi:hypothetical protein
MSRKPRPSVSLSAAASSLVSFSSWSLPGQRASISSSSNMRPRLKYRLLLPVGEVSSGSGKHSSSSTKTRQILPSGSSKKSTSGHDPAFADGGAGAEIVGERELPAALVHHPLEQAVQPIGCGVVLLALAVGGHLLAVGALLALDGGHDGEQQVQRQARPLLLVHELRRRPAPTGRRRAASTPPGA